MEDDILFAAFWLLHLLAAILTNLQSTTCGAVFHVVVWVINISNTYQSQQMLAAQKIADIVAGKTGSQVPEHF